MITPIRKTCFYSLALGLLNYISPASADWWKPALRTPWQIQLNGAINTKYKAKMYDVDLFDTPQSVIDNLHKRGVKVVCYFNAGGFEEWRPDAAIFPAVVLGNPLDIWVGEFWLDISQMNLLMPVMEARLDLALAKHCDGVDPDNVDGYQNNTGFPLTADNQINYNHWLANAAHARGLAVGLKNDLDQVVTLRDVFDFVVNEQCVQYNECYLLKPFIDAKKPVFHIEYEGDNGRICNIAKRLKFNTLIKRLDLKAWRKTCQQR